MSHCWGRTRSSFPQTQELCTVHTAVHNTQCSRHNWIPQLPNSTKCKLRCIYITKPDLTQRNFSLTDIWSAVWHSDCTVTCHLALSTYRYVSSGTQHVQLRAIWHSDRTATCNLALSTYSYVQSGTQHVQLRAIWHSDRTATCHLALRSYSYVPAGTQIVPLRAIWHSNRTATCHLALSTYRINGMSGTCHIPRSN
jgi:hypothetical protein